MKIVVVGLGYVGLSNAVLLAQNNQVIGVDLSRDRIEALKAENCQLLILKFQHTYQQKISIFPFLVI